MENETTIKEKNTIKWQRTVFFIAFILFFPSLIISGKFLGNMKYGVIEIVLAQLFIGISSIKNQVSIMKIKGQKEKSRGKRAVVVGYIAILAAIIGVIVIFSLPIVDLATKN